jgi:hypothetical protein
MSKKTTAASADAGEGTAASSGGDAEQTTSVPATRTPTEWAADIFPPSPRGRTHPELWKHGAAVALNRWVEQAHQQGAPVQLTRDEYQAAIDGACAPEPVPLAAANTRNERGA